MMPNDYEEPPVPEELKPLKVGSYNPPKLRAAERDQLSDTIADLGNTLTELTDAKYALEEEKRRTTELANQLYNLTKDYEGSLSQNGMLRRANVQLMFHLRAAERTIKLLNRAIDEPSLLESGEYPAT